MKADKRLYVNADRSRIVEEDSPDAAFLLYNAGQDITAEDVKKYDLSKADVKAEAKPPETKAVEQDEPRVENKAKK